MLVEEAAERPASPLRCCSKRRQQHCISAPQPLEKSQAIPTSASARSRPSPDLEPYHPIPQRLTIHAADAASTQLPPAGGLREQSSQGPPGPRGFLLNSPPHRNPRHG